MRGVTNNPAIQYVIKVFVFVLADIFLLTVTFKLRERLIFVQFIHVDSRTLKGMLESRRTPYRPDYSSKSCIFHYLFSCDLAKNKVSGQRGTELIVGPSTPLV